MQGSTQLSEKFAKHEMLKARLITCEGGFSLPTACPTGPDISSMHCKLSPTTAEEESAAAVGTLPAYTPAAAMSASRRSRAFFGSLAALIASRLAGVSPTTIRPIIPMPTCGEHLTA